MRFTVPTDRLFKIANAKKVEGRLFTTEFEIKSKQLALLRKLINRAQPKEQKEPLRVKPVSSEMQTTSNTHRITFSIPLAITNYNELVIDPPSPILKA